MAKKHALLSGPETLPNQISPTRRKVLEAAIAALERKRDRYRLLLGMQQPQEVLTGNIADNALLDTISTEDLGSREAMTESLRRIGEALDRVRRGVYDGLCKDCGGKIPKDRLHAIPETEVCITCARDREAGIPAVRPDSGEQFVRRVDEFEEGQADWASDGVQRPPPKGES